MTVALSSTAHNSPKTEKHLLVAMPILEYFQYHGGKLSGCERRRKAALLLTDWPDLLEFH